MMNQYDLTFKAVIVGDTGTGKSCLLLQYTDKRFVPVHDLTIGVEFGSCLVRIGDGRVVRLQVWDTAGQEAFRSIGRAYYRGTCACLLVFDVTRRHTFASIRRWLADASASGSSTTRYILVGNKCDLEHRREVSTEEATALTEELGLDGYIETSAKTGANVDELFTEQVVHRVYQDVLAGRVDPADSRSGVRSGGARSVAPPPPVRTTVAAKCCVIF